MRTTLNLDQDVFEVARSLASAQAISIGAAVSLLARRGISGTGVVEHQRGYEDSRFPTFAVAENAPRFGSEDVKRGLDEE